MRHALQNPKVKFYIGDVRDKIIGGRCHERSGLCVQRSCLEASAQL